VLKTNGFKGANSLNLLAKTHSDGIIFWYHIHTVRRLLFLFKTAMISLGDQIFWRNNKREPGCISDNA